MKDEKFVHPLVVVLVVVILGSVIALIVVLGLNWIWQNVPAPEHLLLLGGLFRTDTYKLKDSERRQLRDRRERLTVTLFDHIVRMVIGIMVVVFLLEMWSRLH